MHVDKIPRLRVDGDILPVRALTSRYPEEGVVNVGAPEVELTSDTLPESLRVYVLEPAN